MLIQAIRRKVDLPIIAAGGIADGQGMAAAFAVGAEGIQMGTRFVSSQESPVHENWKNAILNGAESDTYVLNKTGSPCLRAIKTDYTKEIYEKGSMDMSVFGGVQDLYFGGNLNAFVTGGGAVDKDIGDFLFDRGKPLTLSVSGQGKKLSRVGNASFSLPGSLQSATATRTPVKATLDVEVGGSDVTNLVSSTLSVQNNINWTPYETLHNSLSVTNASNAMYPSDYSLGERVVSGNITQYLGSNNSSTF